MRGFAVALMLVLAGCESTRNDNGTMNASDNSTANIIDCSQEPIDQAASDMDNYGIPHTDYEGYKACLENAYGNEAWEACEKQYSTGK